MIIFVFLFLVGFAITLIGGSYLIRAIRSRDKRRIVMAAALPALYWLGWIGLFIADRPDYTQTMPRESSLIGRWTATPKTLERMKTTGHFNLTEHAITLGTDHSIAMKNIPDCWRDYPPQPENMGKLGGWKGTWDVKPQQAVWGLELSGPGPDGRPGWGCNGCLTLMHQRPPYELALHSGDVDSRIEMIFQREKEWVAAPENADAATCKAHGGKITRLAEGENPMCVTPYPDGGTPCADSSECIGGCYHYRHSHPAIASNGKKGICQRSNYFRECYQKVIRGKVEQGSNCQA